jgi:hypothetical protein
MVKSRRVQVAMYHGPKFMGFADWVPDFIAARYKSRVTERVQTSE